ncbi:MAG: hypothetical protein FD161_1782 [Limisphaerales bacterium]|nr:MAG: hypothetical protein FD161_1782 [Limisphaerales bacterium]TXT47522.1 MAG: hypothetical protein FD140_4219 [Limisphaerales bacterium]
MNRIEFYRINEPFGEFSNFSPHPIVLHGRRWPTVEHYFQAQKFSGTEHVETIRLAHSPMVAARLGRSRQRPLRQDWESVKDGVMREAQQSSRNTRHSACCCSRPATRSWSSTPPTTHTGRTEATGGAATGWANC